IPPTKALMITSKVNCRQFSFNPNFTCIDHKIKFLTNHFYLDRHFRHEEMKIIRSSKGMDC
ncbi:MAG: hypothetical protein ACTHOF_07500, partial [Flavisolibacter sp.]